MNREEFEAVVAEESVEQDDAVQEEVQDETINEPINKEPTDEEVESSDDLPELPEEQKTAFAKRLEREQKKIREQTEKEFQERYESEFGRYKSVVEKLGGDPDKIEKMIQENQARAQAQQQASQFAQYYGWDEEQTQLYIQQQVKEYQQAQELAELKIQIQINDLKDNPDYAGIGSMKDEIKSLISRSNGTLTVEQAYWALGGKSRAEQIRREIEQREIAKRSKPKRTVQSDSPTANVGEKPLDPENEKIRQKLGLSVSEARKLLSDTPKNLEEFRSMKKKGVI